jgi:hypothetical protein
VTAGELSRRVDEAAENPFLRLVARFSASLLLAVLTIVVAPFLYWLTSTTLRLNDTIGGIVIIQTQQQQQLTTVLQAQAKILDTSALEAQARATTDAQLVGQIEALKESVSRNSERIDKQDDRINQLYQQSMRPR